MKNRIWNSVRKAVIAFGFVASFLLLIIFTGSPERPTHWLLAVFAMAYIAWVTAGNKSR